MIATLGNFATKLLSGRPLGITRVHGQEQELTIAGRSVVLYPLYHPAAALYTPAMLKVLEADFARLPELLGQRRRPCAARALPSPSRGAGGRRSGRAARALLGGCRQLLRPVQPCAEASPRSLQVSPEVSLGSTPTEPLGSTQAAKFAGCCEPGNAEA